MYDEISKEIKSIGLVEMNEIYQSFNLLSGNVDVVDYNYEVDQIMLISPPYKVLDGNNLLPKEKVIIDPKISNSENKPVIRKKSNDEKVIEVNKGNVIPQKLEPSLPQITSQIHEPEPNIHLSNVAQVVHANPLVTEKKEILKSQEEKVHVDLNNQYFHRMNPNPNMEMPSQIKENTSQTFLKLASFPSLDNIIIDEKGSFIFHNFIKGEDTNKNLKEMALKGREYGENFSINPIISGNIAGLSPGNSQYFPHQPNYTQAIQNFFNIESFKAPPLIIENPFNLPPLNENQRQKYNPAEIQRQILANKKAPK